MKWAEVDCYSSCYFYTGTGFSGARHGPSLMPGGSPEAWPYIKDIFQAIAAKVDSEPCCDWVKYYTCISA